jgi:hypothetical protein
VSQWCAGRRRAVGALLTLEQGWALAQAWFTDPRRPGWRRKPLAAMAALIRAQGLDGPFWALPEQGEA